MKKIILKIIGYFSATIWAAIACYPFLFMILTSMKTSTEFVTGSIWSLPAKFSLTNYIAVIKEGFWRYFLNSVIIVGGSVLLIILVSTLASYVITRLKFRGSKIVFGTFVLGMMIPIHSTLIPVYQITQKLGLYDS